MGSVIKMEVEGESWFYSEKVKEHFLKPKNFLKDKKEVEGWNAYGKVGNMKCGDIMELWLKINKNKIQDVRWRTFGCASAIASTSAMSEMIKGITIKDALKISAKDIMNELGGLPTIKVHCSVLGDEALREAIKDYEKTIK
jgi:NifU-like protein